MDQQTIIIYISFGGAALCPLIILIRAFLGTKRTAVKNVTGNVNTGDVKGNVTQTYTSTQKDPAKSKRDWFDRTDLVLAFMSLALGLLGAYLKFTQGTP